MRAGIEQNRQDLLERAAEEAAQSRRLRKLLSIVGFVIVRIFLALIIADLRH